MRRMNSIAVMERTTISVSDDVADKLHSLKERGDSYDDVIRRLLAETGEGIDDE